MTPLLYLLLFLSPPIAYRQLSWSDFKGKVPASAQGDACACTNISIGTDTAFAVFFPERSWTKTNSLVVLRHEQVHFAITRHWAGMIDWSLKLNEMDRLSYSHPVEDCIKKWRDMEARYDLETDHGRNEAEQKRWEQLIKL